MPVSELNEINTIVSDLIIKLNKYDDTDISSAKKLLKEVGVRISNHYYKIFEPNGK